MSPWFVLAGCTAALSLTGPAVGQDQNAAKPSQSTTREQDRHTLLQFTAGYDIMIWPTGSILNACFFLGQRAHRRLVVEAAAEWSAAGNIRFDFGQAPGYRDCDPAKPSAIRIGFQPDLASSSRIGTRARDAARSRPTMFIGVGGIVTRTDDDIRYAALHELGHALGLPHEHQHPASPCPAEFKIAAVCERQDVFAAYTELERQETLAMMRSQVRLRRDADPAALPPYDVGSIMHYRFPPALLKGATSSACHTFAARSMSDADTAKIARRYPLDADQQHRFIRARAEILAQDLYHSSPSFEHAERVARLAEAYVAETFPELEVMVPLDRTRFGAEIADVAATPADVPAALCQPRRP